jgi:hypothetical protein
VISVMAARDISSQLTLIVSAHSWLCFDVRCFTNNKKRKFLLTSVSNYKLFLDEV